MTSLLPAEAALLEQLEAKIERGLATFTEVGRALTAIRDQRLYRETHATFATYLDERWQISRARGYQLIDAASVVDAVSTMVDKGLSTVERHAQLSERAARELAPVLRDHGEEAVADVWETVREINGDRPTAAQARAVVQGLKNPASEADLEEQGVQADRPFARRPCLRVSALREADVVSVLPAHVLEQARRILDAEARRLLTDELDVDAAGALTGRHRHRLDRGANQGAAGPQAQPVPIPGSGQADNPGVAA
jgi:hypothetical protein